MSGQIEAIHTERDYEAALAEVERLWGAKLGTPDGQRLDVLANLIEAYEDVHYPMGSSDSVRRSRRRSS